MYSSRLLSEEADTGGCSPSPTFWYWLWLQQRLLHLLCLLWIFIRVRLETCLITCITVPQNVLLTHPIFTSHDCDSLFFNEFAISCTFIYGHNNKRAVYIHTMPSYSSSSNNFNPKALSWAYDSLTNIFQRNSSKSWILWFYLGNLIDVSQAHHPNNIMTCKHRYQ